MRELGFDLPRRLQSVHAGHVDVHHHHIGLARRDKIQRAPAVRGLCHDQKIGLSFENAPEPFSHKTVIVDQQHTYLGCGRRFTRLIGLAV